MISAPSLQAYLSRWRERVKTLAGKIFSPPYLSPNFIFFFLLTAFTHLAVIIMSYSPSYWRGSLVAGGIAPTDLFEVKPIVWLIFSAVYISIAVFCLAVFNYRWSLIGWLTAEIIHFKWMGNWLVDCNYGRWSPTAGAFCEAFDPGKYWGIVALLLGFLVATNIRSDAASSPWKQAEKKAPRLFVALSAFWGLFLLVGIVSAAQTPTSGWIPLELDNAPPPLQNAAHAYDTKRNRLVVFGGATKYINGQWVYENETWEWDGEQWLNVSPPLKDRPPARANADMAYDEERGVMVLYGGLYKGVAFCDTWEWDGEKWIGACSPQCPGARYGHEMYYDPIRRKVVLYGGYDNKTYFNDAWEWDGSTWTRIETAGDSPSASGHAVAYNPDGEFALGVLSGTPGGTWIFKDNRWTRLPMTIGPGNRSSTRLVYEPARKAFFVFGGYADGMFLNDTWFFDGREWNFFTDTKFQPPVRSNMIMWYDRARKHVMLFGGYHAATVYNDTWELILPDK